MQNYITILEDQQEYTFPFTRIKQVEKNLDEMAGGDGAAAEEEEEKKTEEIKEDEPTNPIQAEAAKMVDKLK